MTNKIYCPYCHTPIANDRDTEGARLLVRNYDPQNPVGCTRCVEKWTADDIKAFATYLDMSMFEAEEEGEDG